MYPMLGGMVLTRILVVAFALLLAVAAAPVSGAEPVASTQRMSVVEQNVVREVNRVRAAHELRSLNASPGLRSSAVSHSRTMLQEGFFDHTAPDGGEFSQRIRRFYAPRSGAAWIVGENLYSKTAAFTAKEVVAAWLQSPPHRDILLSGDWRDVGIGAVRAPSAGGVFGGQATWVVTADFGAR
jgi:uncharacterized protein YkwD